MGTFVDRHSGGLSVIVVGVDFSGESDQAIQYAREMARSWSNLEIHLVHATNLHGVPQSLGEAAFDSAGIAVQNLDRLSAALGKICDDLAADLPERVFGHVRLGPAHREIVQLASDVSADLIVVGTKGRTGIERFVLGSVAERVLRYAPCPVLVVRPKREPAWIEIEPPCPDCVDAGGRTEGAQPWCERHSEHHARPHTYYQYPESYGMGSLTFRE